MTAQNRKREVDPPWGRGLMSACFVVVMVGVRPVAGEVNIPPGFEIVQITDFGGTWNNMTSINNCGEIVFHSKFSGMSIMLYDNGRLIQITDDQHRNAGAVINNQGTIDWNRGIDGAGVHQIVRYQSGEVTVLADNPDGTGGNAINNLEHAAWGEHIDLEGCGWSPEIMFFDRTSTEQITDGELSNQGVAINEADHLAWTVYDFCISPYFMFTMVYADGVQIVLDSGDYLSMVDLNDATQVIWSGDAGTVVWEDGVTTVLFPGGWNPKINNLGTVFYIEPSGPYWDAFLYRNGEFYQLVDGPVTNAYASINDHDEAAWVSGNYPVSEILHLRRIRDGEADFDGDVDIADHAVLAGCLTGPGRVDRLCDCRFLDIDHDGDVDLADAAIFQNNFTGG